jgi:molybdenum cofactor biosynthesis enzyme MoaA
VTAPGSIPTRVQRDSTLRVKIIDACGMTCVFCHNEGTPVVTDNRGVRPVEFKSNGKSGRVSIYLSTNGASFLPTAVPPDESFRSALLLLRDALGVTEVTLHPKLPELVGLVRRAGFAVCMTSNGENGAQVLPAAARAGLDRVNFSIFGTTPEELAEVPACSARLLMVCA